MESRKVIIVGSKKEVDADYINHRDRNVKIVNLIISLVISIAIFVLSALNIFILSMNLTGSSSNNIFGTTPVLVQGESLMPHIKNNDLVFFENDVKEGFAVGDIVLYNKDLKMNIAAINKINDDGTVNVDITNYGEVDTGVYADTVNVEIIQGKYIYKNHMLGVYASALVSMSGRVFLILLPVLLIFTIAPLKKFVRRYSEFREFDKKVK